VSHFATDELSRAVVLSRITSSPKTSARKLNQELNMSDRSLRRVLKGHSFHPYKIHLTHELHEDDIDRRV
jgi:hypothetical protein